MTHSDTAEAEKPSIIVAFIFALIVTFMIVSAIGSKVQKDRYDRGYEDGKNICNEWQTFDLAQPISKDAWMFEKIIGVGWNEDGTVKNLTITKCLP